MFLFSHGSMTSLKTPIPLWFIWGGSQWAAHVSQGRWKAEHGAVWIRVCWRSVGKLQRPGSRIKIQRQPGNTSDTGTRARWLTAHLPKCWLSPVGEADFMSEGHGWKYPVHLSANFQERKTHRKLERGGRHRNWQAFKNSKTRRPCVKKGVEEITHKEIRS